MGAGAMPATAAPPVSGAAPMSDFWAGAGGRGGGGRGAGMATGMPPMPMLVVGCGRMWAMPFVGTDATLSSTDWPARLETEWWDA